MATAKKRAKPVVVALSEPLIRSFQTWSPALIKAAEMMADGGNLRLAADLCEWLFSDDRVKAVLDSRTDSLLGLDLSFEMGLGRKKGQAVRALEAGEDWWAAYPETELKLLQAWGLILGVGLGRHAWEMKGDRLIPKLVVINPRHLRFDWSTRKWMLTVLDGEGPDAKQSEVEVTPGDGTWVMYTPYGSVRPWVYGAYRALGRWVLLKQLAIGDWAFFSERQGMGTWAALGADGDHDTRKEIAEDISSLGRNAVIALPAGFDLKLIESTARNWETFSKQIETSDNGVAVTLLGQNLTTQNDGGSNAATTQHGKTALGRTKSDVETLSTTLHDQSLTWWALFNFGDAALAPWPVWNTTPEKDLKERAATVQMVSQAVSAFYTARAPVDVAALLAEFLIPLLPAPAAPPAVSPEPGSPNPAQAPEAAPAEPLAAPGAEAA